MSNPSIEFKNPAGERLTFRRTGAETNGELLVMEATYVPHSEKPPLHYHPYQEEQFEVLRGSFRARVGEVEHTYQAGDKFTVPANTPHWMHNISDKEGCLLWEVRPALKTQDFFATMWGLIEAGKTNANGLPDLLQLAVILRTYNREFRASRPPYFVQKIFFALLAPLGRMMGYRATVDPSN